MDDIIITPHMGARYVVNDDGEHVIHMIIDEMTERPRIVIELNHPEGIYDFIETLKDHADYLKAARVFGLTIEDIVEKFGLRIDTGEIDTDIDVDYLINQLLEDPNAD